MAFSMHLHMWGIGVEAGSYKGAHWAVRKTMGFREEADGTMKQQERTGDKKMQWGKRNREMGRGKE